MGFLITKSQFITYNNSLIWCEPLKNAVTFYEAYKKLAIKRTSTETDYTINYFALFVALSLLKAMILWILHSTHNVQRL